MTIKTYPDAITSGLRLSIEMGNNGNPSAAVFSAVDTFHEALADLVDFGTMVIYYFTTEYLTIPALTAYNKTQDQLEQALEPMMGGFDVLNLT